MWTRRPERSGQDHFDGFAHAPARCDLGRDPHRWAGHPRRDPGESARGLRPHSTGHEPVQSGLIENIRYGRPNATDDEVMAAARRAHAHEFISSWRMATTPWSGSAASNSRAVSARGSRSPEPFSAMRRSCCSMRPTSALDSHSEHMIHEAMREAMVGKTVIAIAHRLSTVMDMDRLIVLQRGAIVADGTHTELLRQGGLYADSGTTIGRVQSRGAPSFRADRAGATDRGRWSRRIGGRPPCGAALTVTLIAAQDGAVCADSCQIVGKGRAQAVTELYRYATTGKRSGLRTLPGPTGVPLGDRWRM